MGENYSIVQSERVLSEYVSKWKLIDFKELIEDVSSGNKKLKKSEYLEKGDLPVVDQGQELISGYTDEEDAVKANPPYVVFGDHTRIFKEVNFKMALGADGVKLLKVREEYEEECDYKFIYYFFQSLDIPNTGYNRHYKYLKNVKIPLPSLSEQKAIVAKLDRAQRLIDIDKEMLAKYDELIQSVFLEMFGDPVTNPKGLKEKEFGELVEVTGGYAFKSKDFVDDESGVKVVKIANVHFIDLDWSDVQYLPIESLEEHEKYSLKEGDILLALTRPIINSLDAVKAVVVKESDLPALLNQRVARIRVDSDDVTEDYITSFIYTQHFKRQIEKYASTSLQPNVSNKEVSKIKVLVPEIDQQRKFSEIRQRILNERDTLAKNQKKSEELFSSLVQGAFG